MRALMAPQDNIFKWISLVGMELVFGSEQTTIFAWKTVSKSYFSAFSRRRKTSKSLLIPKPANN